MRVVRWRKSVCVLLAALCLGCAAAPIAAPSAAPPAPPALSTGPATIVVGQQPCCPKQTLPEFLGLTGLCKAAGGLLTRLRARLGMRWPGLEGKPAVLPITDPANADSSNPAVSAAAEIKAEEDAAPQKIKGLRYLATIGCGGCYPDVEQALLAGLDDCTEEVRYEAAAALRSTAGNPCQFCRDDKCCSPAVRKRLQDIAFGVKEDTGCYKESSARVRRMARLALAGCCGTPEEQQQSTPVEGPGAPEAGEGPAPLEATAIPRPAASVGWRLPPVTNPSPPPQANCPTCARTSYVTTPYPPIGAPRP
jgi:hypothetical protein